MCFALSFFLSFLFSLHFCPHSHRVCCSLFVVCSIIQKCGAFFWQALKQGNEKWLTQFSSSSFSLALLLSNTWTPHTHPRTNTHMNLCILHIPSQMISEVSSAKKKTPKSVKWWKVFCQCPTSMTCRTFRRRWHNRKRWPLQISN